jgi:NADPH:quinone reductase-like Zn-dependent oxidoreductase
LAPYERQAILRLFFGLRKPRFGRPGVDVAGEVEAVGKNVTQFKPGDAVFGDCHGAFAEYVCTAESKLAMKPDNVTFEQAASVDVAGLTALQGLRNHGRIRPGSKVLINGAAGGVGTFAVQLAKSFGVGVTGVCSTRNIDMVRSIGADEIIDYTQNDFTTSNQRYDLILDCVGNHSFSACRRILNPDGRFVLPRILGVWLIVNCFTYLALSFTGLLLPQYLDMGFRIAFPVLFGEMAMALWLVIMGAKVQPLVAAAS